MPKEEIKANIPTAFDRSQEPEAHEDVVYTDEEQSYLGFMRRRIMTARDRREDKLIEFDDQNYSTYYQTNLKAANSYNPPRKNREDARIVTGTTQEKETTLLSTLLNFNFEPNIRPYDENDNEIYELGEVMEDLVSKSRKMEKYDDRRRLYYKELLDQGTCFIEEVKVEQIIYDKKMKEGTDLTGMRIDSIKWDTRLKKLYANCETRLLSGESVYLGNIREFFLDKQPFAFIRDVIHYDEAKMIYGEWERFENVPRKVVRFSTETEEYVDYRNWSLLEIDDDYVEVIKYQDPLNNEYMILLNGVMMMPIKFPLTSISPSGKFTFAKGDAEPISKFFAYSKSTPAKTKVDQQVLDETIKMILLKMKKSLFPPMANNSGKILSRKIFWPAVITNDVDVAKLQEIGANTGPTPAEFNTFQLMKQIVDEKSVDPSFSGDQVGGDPTATEIVTRKQQQMLKLGQTVVGVISLETELVRLRIHNILANWTLPIDERVDEVRKELVKYYRSFDVDTIFSDNGRKGRRIVMFDEESVERFGSPEGSQELSEIQEKIKEKTGEDIRFTFLNPEAMQQLNATFDVSMVPTEKSSSELDRVLFEQSLRGAMELFGPEEINKEYAKQRYAVLSKEDPEKFFSQQTQQPQVAPEVQPQSQPRAAQQLTQAAGGVQQPSLNTLLSQ